MVKLLYNTIKENIECMTNDWYENELKTLQGETIVFKDYYGNYIDYSKSVLEVYIRNKDKDLYFKSSRYGKTSLYGEIIFSELAKALDIETVKVAPAIKIDSENSNSYITGILMSDLVEESDGMVLMSISALHKKTDVDFKSSDTRTLETTVEALKKYKKMLLATCADKVVIDENLIPYHKQMIFMDYLAHNVDRHDGNIAILVSKDKNNTYYIKPAKMFDNELSFLFHALNWRIAAKIEIDVKKSLNSSLKEFDYYYSFDEFKSSKDLQIQYNKQIVDAIKNDRFVAELYQKSKALDIDKVLKGISENYKGFEIPKFYLDLAKQVFEYKIKKLTRALAKTKEEKKPHAETREDQQNF